MLPLLITLQYVNEGKNAVMSRLAREEKGATAVEYGLLIALVAIVLVVALAVLKTPVENLVTSITTKMTVA
ncbi:Flp family type IVb pilin [Kocuria flava]|uniref:Flp family type IVb pilin n=1 Tax=Kocuria flava TaxID=446860 RepID=UPI002F95A5B8